MKKVFALMAIAAMFAVACSKDDDNKKDDPKPDPKPVDEYTGPVEGTSEWSVVGTLLESNWGSGAHGDYVCAESDGVFVLKNVKLVATDEFKFRQNKAWDNAYKGVFASLGAAFDVDNEPGGDNIKPGLDGIYDLYLNVASAQAAIVAKDGAAPSWKPAGPQPSGAITIDGDFSDWAALDPTKISETYGDEDATHPVLEMAVVYADANYVYVYFEYDAESIEHEPDVEHVPFHIYINTDGDATTGGFGDQWADACIDFLLEGFIYPDGAEIGSYDPGACSWSGEVTGSGWKWAELAGGGFCEGAGVEGKYELAINRSVVAATGFPIADTFSIGFDIQQGWNSVGILPNEAPSEENPAGLGMTLEVVTDK